MRTILKTIALLTAFACAETGSAQNGWTQKADCGGGARRGAVGFSIGSKGYIGTGYAAGGGATSDFWEYDPTTDSWSQKANVNPQGIAYGVGLSIGNKGYIGSLPSWWEYDPTTNTWTQKSNFGVTQQRINAIGFSIGSKGYVGTGQEVNPNGPATSDLWEYDPLTDTWTQRADFPGGGRAAAVGFTIGAKGYVGTGSSSFADHNDLWEYDPVTDAWTQKADLSSSTRFDAVGFSIGTKGYVGTGRDAELNVTNTYNDLWEYDPALDSWVQKVDFVGGDRTAAIGFSVGQLGYVGSGLINGSISNNGPITADFWEFDPTQGCTVGAACDDGIPCTINDVVSSSCLCGGTAAADTDGDGICDLTDPCPLLPNLSNGQSCDDGDACTINDAVTNCLCAGTFQDTDNDGVCDAADPCPLLANLSPGNACNDGDACTVNDVVDAFCACNGSFVDTDDDGICNANDNCPSQPGVIGSPCDDGNACTINDVVTSTCQCQGSYLPDADGDGICDDQDDCPNTPGTIGSVCDDGNANTVNDVLSAICVCEGSPAPSDAWTQRAAFPVAGRKDAVGFSIGDFGYMGTGADDVNVFRDLWKYDPNTGSWAQMADMGGTVRSGAFAFATGGFGYVGEGMDDLGAMQQDLWMFDPVNNAWTEVSSTDPQGNGRFKAVAFSIGDLGYVGTGQTQFGATQDLWSFDPSTLSWTPLSDFGGGVRSHAVGFSIGTKGYVGTGTDGSSNFSDLWEYDPITGTWTQRTDYAGTARKTAVAFVVGTKGYITTGEDAAGEPLDLWEYDPNADSWTQRADFAGTARRGAASFAVGGRGYVCTGVSNGGYLSDLWEYAPTTSCVAGDACDDGDACTINDVRDGNCTCAGTLADSDSDGTCDANDGCPNDPDKIVPGICGCGVADTDTDGDGTADCNDSCPYLFGQNGDACGGGACMSNGVIAGCVCTAVPINQPAGDTYATSIPIVLNNAGTATVSGNNQPCYTSTYTGAQAQASADVWYSINTGACATSSMSVSLCGTGSLNDTYLHLLDGSGVSHLASNDDNGPSCAGLKSSISYAIAANTTYTIVVEGYSSNTGSYTLAVTVPGTVDTDGDGTRDCADNCPNDPNKIATGACGCGVADTDSDNDGTANCNDDCPLDPLKIAPGICGCGVADTDSDSDGTANCNDGCPSDPNKVAPGNCGCGNPEPGALCNDNDPSTTNDMITAGCVCAGTPAVCNDNQVTLTLQTDANGAQTSWEIKILGGAQVCSGSGYPNNSTIVPNCCLPNGCYQLLVYDSFGDGMTTGGYVLRNATNKRIIDNANDGVFTYTSSVANGFCVPLGTDALQPTSCDLSGIYVNSVIYAVPNAAVSAQYGVGNQADDGYQFWFFDPDGSYGRTIFKSHAAPGSPGTPMGPTACASLLLSSIVTSPLPVNKLLNVRVRSRVNGVYSDYGPACRITLANPTASCVSQLVPTAGSTFSCGATGKVVGSSSAAGKIHTTAVSGANKYQFEFQLPGTAYLRTIASTTTALTLNAWATSPLVCGTRTYNVRVRASFDNGNTYCNYGPTCTVQITNNAPNPCTPYVPSGSLQDAVQEAGSVALFPNPARDGSVTMQLSGLSTDVEEVTVDVFDLFGRRVIANTIATDGAEELSTVLTLPASLTTGVYLVNVTAGDSHHSERLMIE